jgi:hypothetical protein
MGLGRWGGTDGAVSAGDWEHGESGTRLGLRLAQKRSGTVGLWMWRIFWILEGVCFREEASVEVGVGLEN